jgi:tetratricopeptide (TPR) repeat protein
MPYAKTSGRAEQRGLREQMRARGLTHRQIAVEFGRRYNLRPRAAWRHAHGWSLKQAATQITDFAARAGVDPDGNTVAMTGPHLCEVEAWPGFGPKATGRRPTPYLLALLAAVYDCAITDLLDLADYEQMRAADRIVIDKASSPDDPRAPARPSLPQHDQLDTGAVCTDAGPVRRHEFLKLTGVTLASLLAPPLVHEWPGTQDVASREITDPLLAQARARTEQLRWLDRKQGAHDLLDRTSRHASSLTSIWRHSHENPLRRVLAEAAADACHLVAYQMYDQGDRVRAVEWYRCAAELAARSDAKDLYVFAVCGMALMHACNGNGELALSVLHQLTPLRLSEAAACYIAVYQGHAHASLKQRDAAVHALDRAADRAARAGGEAPSPWLGIPDHAFIERQQAMILAGFGAPEALGILSRLDQQTPPVFRRYRITLLTDQAMAHARMGDADQAAALLEAALHRNTQIRSAEKRARVLDVRRVLQPYASASQVQALDEVIRETRLLEQAARPSGT